ncbi:MAG: class I SAM-dependent methyltransferase [Ilumatobacteraceae bacterium]
MVTHVSDNGWLRMIEENPGHSAWYIERFKSMAAEGRDLDGEARFVDAMAGRGARVLDAGCGPGRVGARLAALGHTVVGVDIDPALIVEAEAECPGSIWLARDLSALDLPADGVAEPFDVILSAGNVMTFLAPSTRRDVLERLRAHLAPEGRLVIGFGGARGYEFDDFFADAAAVGLAEQLRLSSWDVRPFDETSTFLVAVLGAG